MARKPDRAAGRRVERARYLAGLLFWETSLDRALVWWDELSQLGPLPEDLARKMELYTGHIVAELSQFGPHLAGGIVYSVGPDGTVRRALPG